MSNRVTVPVQLADHSYEILIGGGLLVEAGQILAERFPGRSVRVVTDSTVATHHLAKLVSSLAAAGYQVPDPMIVPAGESSKSFTQYASLCEGLLATRLDRQTLLIALGGGVIGDLAGFAAASLLRGLDFVQIPTTLLAQVDSSVGGKTGINAAAGKNLVGAFHQPLLVLADSDTLATLPRRELLAGYAEVLKYGLIGDAGFFSRLDKIGPALLAGEQAAQIEAVAYSCRAKAAVVARDPLEKGERALLNFGHTFGHALESLLHYDGRLLHGEGVAIGMILALDLSVRLGLCAAEDLARVRAHYAKTGLPSKIDPAWELTTEAIISAMQTDKKTKDGKLRFILARKISETFVADDIPATMLNATISG